MTGRRTIIAAIAALASALAGSAAAQGYPDHIIEIVVPSTPGSSADILGRVLADGMAAKLGQRFVVLTSPARGGILGTAEVARAKPDGYTLMHGAVVLDHRAAADRAADRLHRAIVRRRSARPSRTTR